MATQQNERLTRRGLLRRAGALAVAVPAVSALLAACAGGGGGGGGTSGGGGGKITIEMSEYKFNPATITVSPGASVTVTLKNVGTLQHDYHIDVINQTSPLVDPGKSVDWTFTAPSQAGTYDTWCTVPGHKELGMVGKLEVK
uniref:EfeO-type cupredoxin-like domain-containing protein n=1 Tax=Thermomicrobium roseum TaxID=500 RepID=A0A7C1JYC6_THERO